MLVLHAAVRNGLLALWGEVPFEPATESPPKRAGRPRKGFDVPPPPRCGATFELLRDALDRAGDAALVAGAEYKTLIGWLPAIGGRPVPSSPLIGEQVSLEGAPATPWSVDAIEIEPRIAVGVLASVVGKRLLAPGILAGATLAWFATAMRFAATLVARGHVLPSVEGSGRSWSARWMLAPAGGEHEQLASLVRGIPPAALAFGLKHDAPPAGDRVAVIESFLSAMADHLMRRPGARILSKKASLHDRWMAALTAEDATLAGDSAELESLRQTLIEWRRPVAERALFDFRLAFRLEEPDASDDWTIRLLLQGVSDPSLILPLSLVWQSDGRGEDATAARKLLRRGRGDARRFVLGSLAHAAALSGAVDEALRRPTPSEIATDTNGAFAFLSSDAGALESSGFGVFLPSWWSRKGTKKRLSLRAETRSPKFESKAGLSLDALIDVRWRVALGDQTLSMEELQSLARMKMPLVRLRGQWVQLRSDEIEEALRFARQKAAKLSVSEIVKLDLSRKVAGATALEVSEVDGEGAIGELLERLQGKREWQELAAPKGFNGTLRPYQARGFSWLDFLGGIGLGACLADDMGLGKTIQTLALVQKLWAAKKQPLLLICPTSVTGNWVREAARFTPSLPVLLHHGIDRKKGTAFAAKAKKSAIVISSYSLLSRDASLLQSVSWKGVVLDEAQNVKNSETKQSKAARSIKAGFRIALTGTPVENNIGDLWSILEFLNPGYLGSAAAFRRSFFLPIQTRRDPEAIEALRRLTGPFILRRLKTDRSIIADLPVKNEMKVYCSLTKEQASLYQAVVQEAEAAIADSEGIGRKGLILATITKLKQVCNHPRQLLGDGSAIEGRSGKLTRLSEMLAEAVEVGDRALVFTQFAEMGSILQTHLQEQFGVEALYLHGGTPRTQRDTMVERFQKADGGPPIFILSLKAGGTGLNLTRASHVSLRSLVESGGREPGHRPRFPHRPDALRAGA